MNRLMIIGNLVRNPELRTTTSGDSVCSFSVAVNRRKKNPDGQSEADYFGVSAWRQLGENCQKYLAKGRKVFVMGPVSCRTYERQDGSTGVSMEIIADTVEFLSPKGDGAPRDDGFTPVDEELPFDQ